jgi:Cu(I)/Ag(I) efflux system membrane fusion protein
MSPAALRWRGWHSAAAGLIAGAVLVAAIPADTFFADPPDPAAAPTGDRYACPMLCTFAAQPGPCPVCGMAMERVTAGDLNREQQRRMGLATVRIAEGPATAIVRAWGVAEWDERFSQVIIARVPGRIVKRHDATFGCCQEIVVGEPVIDLYSPEAYAAQGELAAALRAGDERLASAIEARFARWNLAHVAADIRAGKPPTDTITIRSPTDGQAYLEDQDMVNSTLVVGSEVAADTPLIKVVDGHRLTVELRVPEAQGRFLHTGQRVHLATDGEGDLPDIEAVIGRVGNEIAPTTRTREVLVYLRDGRKRILPGALISARIQAALAQDLSPADPLLPTTWGSFTLVPKDAILSTGVRHIAWRVAERRPDGSLRFEPVAVALGLRLEGADGDDRFIVRAGLKPGDEIAARGAFLVDSQAQLAGTASLIYPDGAVRAAPGHAH